MLVPKGFRALAGREHAPRQRRLKTSSAAASPAVNRTNSGSPTSPNTPPLGFQQSSQHLLEVVAMAGPKYSLEHKAMFFDLIDPGGTVPGRCEGRRRS